MANWIYLVSTNSKDLARETEFSNWYNNIHLPDVLETPGFVGAKRYQITEPMEGKGKFLAVYEMDCDDGIGAVSALRLNMVQKKAEGRFSELLDVTDKSVYQQIFEIHK